jgi:hypothetical protein
MAVAQLPAPNTAYFVVSPIEFLDRIDFKNKKTLFE